MIVLVACGTIGDLVGAQTTSGRTGVRMAISIAIYGQDFQRFIEQGFGPGEYRYRILAEGDSWMDRSSAFTASLPDYLARDMEAHQESTLIINLAMFGDTMRRIGEAVAGEFTSWIRFMAFDAILLSAAGNDFIDAARDPDPGKGILNDMHGQPLPARGYDCVRKEAVSKLVTTYLDPNFSALYDTVRGSHLNADTPIFLNNYDTPTARNAPAPPGKKAWLYEAYRKNGIDPSLWPDLTDGLFNDIQTTIAGWCMGRQGIHSVPTDGTLTPGSADDTGDSGDWINEIHPNRAGWKKLSRVWCDAIRKVI